MKKILNVTTTKILEVINCFALRLTRRSANHACNWLYFQEEEPEVVKELRKF